MWQVVFQNLNASQHFIAIGKDTFFGLRATDLVQKQFYQSMFYYLWHYWNP